MKLFVTGHSVNWVDKNNRMAGYTLERDCCEYSGFYVSNAEDEVTGEHSVLNYRGNCVVPYRELNEEINKVAANAFWESWDFTGNYRINSVRTGEDEEGRRTVAFEIENQNNEKKWLILFNDHNGWYSHGFQFKKGDEVIAEGEL
jgi:hypothetical protein